MKKKLYLVVEKQLNDVGDDIQETNGWKTITVYEMVNNEPKLFTSIECSNSDESTFAVSDYLCDNGYSDDEFEFIIL